VKALSETEVLSLALREIGAGVTRALAILEAQGPVPDNDARRAAAMDFTGLTRDAVLRQLRAHGYDGRAFGALKRHGYIIHRPDGLYDGGKGP